jgi:hypothetical protein
MRARMANWKNESRKNRYYCKLLDILICYSGGDCITAFFWILGWILALTVLDKRSNQPLDKRSNQPLAGEAAPGNLWNSAVFSARQFSSPTYTAESIPLFRLPLVGDRYILLHMRLRITTLRSHEHTSRGTSRTVNDLLFSETHFCTFDKTPRRISSAEALFLHRAAWTTEGWSRPVWMPDWSANPLSSFAGNATHFRPCGRPLSDCQDWFAAEWVDWWDNSISQKKRIVTIMLTQIKKHIYARDGGILL